MEKNHIEKVWIERQIDEHSDTSCIGEYTDKKDDWNICRRCGEFVAIAEKGNNRQYEIDEEVIELENEDSWNCTHANDVKIEALQKERNSLELHTCPLYHREYSYFKPYAGGEEEGSDDYQKYGKYDFERMEGLNSQDWYFMGIIAKAEILTTSGTMQVIRSGGLWGIESDSGAYLEEVGKDELENLRLELTALGFGKRAIDNAFQNVETKDK